MEDDLIDNDSWLDRICIVPLLYSGLYSVSFCFFHLSILFHFNKVTNAVNTSYQGFTQWQFYCDDFRWLVFLIPVPHFQDLKYKIVIIT